MAGSKEQGIEELARETGEVPAFLSEQIITYLGNKRGLLPQVAEAVRQVRQRLGGRKLVCGDLFAGSGIISRYLKGHAAELYTNDLEGYSACINRCYLSNCSEVDMEGLSARLEGLKRAITEEWAPGFITELYAPQDEQAIRPGERAFYTRRNAIYLDTARRLIAREGAEWQDYLLAPLLYGASVHNNTAGIFKGFYKNRAGVGQYGGEGKNALTRILGSIELQLPVFSRHECPCHVSCQEAGKIVHELPELDLCYLDPPYNQHPYGSNYFMLNLLLHYRRPEHISAVSGIPADWERSAYNKPQLARSELFRLIENCPARFILISYNSEGFIRQEDFTAFLSSLGRLTFLQTDYNTFRGSRNLRNRPLSVKEYLFLLERS